RCRMSGIDSLPVEQRAVLQLLLQQGRPYHDLSGLLDIDAAEVRRRAHSALDALGPDETGLDPERRGEIGDYLLGQQDDAGRAATHRYLEGSPAGRAWARVVAGELREVAGDRLPEIPAGGRDDGAGATAEAATAAPAPAEPEARPGAPRSSRLGGALLLGGVALVQRAQGQEQIVAAVQGLPKPKKGGYGIWLYSGPGKAKWLGFFASQDSQGRLLARGQLTTPINGFREVLVTREAKGNP